MGLILKNNYIFNFWHKKTQIFSILLLFLSEVGYSYTAVLFTNWNKVFFDHLQEKKIYFLSEYIIEFLIISAVSFFFFSFSSFLVEWISLRWSKNLVETCVFSWLNSKHFIYPICKNTEQRISDDSTKLTSLSLMLFRNVLRALFLLIVFLPILWDISNQLNVFKGFLVYIALFIAFVGSVIFQGFFGKKMNFLQQNIEESNASFRVHLTYDGLHAQQIVLLKGNQREYFWLLDKFYITVKYMKKMIFWEFWFVYLQNIFIKLNAVLATFILTPFYLIGKISFGVLSQSTTIFFYVSDALSFLPRYTKEIALMSAAYNRLMELQVMELQKSFISNQDLSQKIKHIDSIFIDQSISFKESKGDYYLKNLKVFIPRSAQNSVISIKEMFFKKGERILIKGKSGIGKTTFLKTLAGIWDKYEGQIHMPKNAFFSSTQIFIPLCNLYEAVIYPNKLEISEHEAIKKALEYAGLVCDIEIKIDQLSSGQKQRLLFARIFYHKPDYVFIDEPTSSLNEDAAVDLMNKFFELLPESCLLMITHQDFFDGIFYNTYYFE